MDYKITVTNNIISVTSNQVGVSGPRGAVGPQGPIGPIGLQGPQGIQGLTGSQGPAGTSLGTGYKESFIATEGQTMIYLSNTYPVGINVLSVFVNGLKQRSDAYTEASSSSISLTEVLVAGDVVEVQWSSIHILSAVDAVNATYMPAAAGIRRVLQDKLRETISIKDFGAHSITEMGYETFDSTAAIQAAINLGISVQAPPGVYRITSELVLKTGSKLIGSGAYSAFANSGAGNSISPLEAYSVGSTVILYDGPVLSTACIIRASSEAVGIEPTNTETRNLINCGISKITLNGNGKAGIGLYAVRALSNNNFDEITVVRTTCHAFLVMIAFIGSVKRWCAYLNEGCGITIGLNVFGWASHNTTVDEIHFDSLFAFLNGHNSSRTPLGAYNKSTGYDKEYGVGIGQGRALKFTNLQSIKNGGVGIYTYADRWPINVDTFYTELNCQSDIDIGTNGRYGIWVNGVAGGVTRHLQFKNGYMQGSGTTLEYDGVMLAGTEPSRSGEDAVILEQIPLLKHITADWGNYRLVDSDSSVVIAGANPYYIPQVINGQYNMGISGTAAIAISGGAISSAVVSGNIQSVTYTDLGDYRVSFSNSMTTNNYLAVVSGNENRSVAIANKGVTGFDIKSKAISAGAFTASDSATVSVIVCGGYTV